MQKAPVCQAIFRQVMSNSENSILDALNPAQREAVTSGKGPLLVQAGPGTGKTRVLTCRIAWLLEKEAHGRFLAITFTNQAATEISGRVRALAGPDAENRVKVATFHSWALSFLKECNAERHVVSQADAVGIMAEVMKKSGLRGQPRAVFQAVSRARQYWPVRAPENMPEFRAVFQAYQAAKKEYGVWDFDDLMVEAVHALERAECRKEFRRAFSAVLVDEFQDVSPVQYRLLRAMMPPDGQVTVIGDVNQAIYGFRGASPAFMNRFAEDFVQVKSVTLSRAYRCPQIFLDAARRVIGQECAPELKSARGTGRRIIFKPHRDTVAEARWIAHEIERNVGSLSFDSMNAGTAQGNIMRSLADVAVLFRTRRVGEEVARALFEEGVPYQLSAKRDPMEQESLRNIWRLYEAVRGRSAEYHLSRLPGRRDRWVRIGNNLKAAAPGLELPELLKSIASALDIEIDQPEVAGLIEAARHHPEVDSLAVLLRDEVDVIRSRTEAVSLLSLHASKGLEFPVVFIAGCDDEVIPWKGSPVDEEARLFYVGLTRASERLYLTYPRKCRVNGAVRSRRPSIFIKKIPDDLKMTPVAKKRQRKSTMKQRQKSLF